jgi:hypothetical protein
MIYGNEVKVGWSRKAFSGLWLTEPRSAPVER